MTDASMSMEAARELAGHIRNLIDQEGGQDRNMTWAEIAACGGLYAISVRQQDLLEVLLARIEALEAAARLREGDGR